MSAEASGTRGPAAGRALPLTAGVWLVVLMASWGFQLVTVKLALPEMSAAAQSLVRAILATALLSGWMRLRGEPMLVRDAALAPGLWVGSVFAVEFLLIFGGLAFTTASRGVIFLYSMPLFTAGLARLFLPAERLDLWQTAGLGAAFLGLVVAFADGLGAPTAPNAWIGDLMMLSAAFLWASSNIVIKATALRAAPATRVLWYQLALSIPVSAIAVALEPRALPASLSPGVLLVILYQSVWVAFLTYLVWFRLMARHPVPILAAFSFLSPLFAVLFGHLLLGERLDWRLGAALALVIGGMVLINRPKSGR
ncbi:DMT family transporter [Prosthecomicrobium sp. N25]|uniref:DMT family transporter n=1 Tax=Prosthecomicrobium sp. N25 TaxID=3129254 RepID=UPI0030770BB3